MRPDRGWDHSGGSSLSGCALGIAGFVRVRLVRLRVPCDMLGSFGFDWCVRVRAGGRLVRSGSSG